MYDSMEAWGLTGTPNEDATVSDLLLIATELLSNAVKFSSGDVTLSLTWTASALRVAVTDNAPSRASPRTPGLDSGGGRGLAIIAALSRRWGQTPFADGCKEVWAEVPVTPRGGAGRGRGPVTPASLGG
jgi:Histidine kinase-like ATPase domain